MSGAPEGRGGPSRGLGGGVGGVGESRGEKVLLGPCLLLSGSHNCNHIFIYFVIVMKWFLPGFYSDCFNQDRAPVFSIPVYVASYCQIILPETAVSIMPL